MGAFLLCSPRKRRVKILDGVKGMIKPSRYAAMLCSLPL